MTKEYHDPEVLRSLYHGERLDTTEIADKFDVSPTTIRRNMEKHGIDRVPMGPKITPPGLCMDSRGYEIFAPEDGGGQLKHHRLLAIAEYGFDAVDGNDIHHSNGIPWDNRPSNIEVVDHADHARIHAQEVRPWEA